MLPYKEAVTCIIYACIQYQILVQNASCTGTIEV